VSSKGAFSVLGIFDSPQLLMTAIPAVKGKVEARLEAYTPYPIHGMDKALGLKKSPVGGMVLIMGVIGAISALGFQMWTSGVDYPLITAGKPYFSWEAFIPIMFEVTVLFATFTAGLGMLLLLNRLPLFRHPMLRSNSLPLLSGDKFGLAIESSGKELDVEGISALLKEAGAGTIEVIQGPAPMGPVSPKFFAHILGTIAISCMVAGYLTYWSTKLFPVLPPMIHMLDQPRLDPQRFDSYFKDGFGMRMPVPETVTQEALPYTIKNEDDAGILENPLPRTEKILKEGRFAFNNHCSVCHGLLGNALWNGKPTLSPAYGAKPANLVSESIIDLPDGKIHHVIMRGKNAMPSYAADLDDTERWAVVNYVRVLQRAMNATNEDFK
jgi:hypothetical protein